MGFRLGSKYGSWQYSQKKKNSHVKDIPQLSKTFFVLFYGSWQCCQKTAI